MLQCDSCVYFKFFNDTKGRPDEKIAVCEFTGSIFMNDVKNLDIEYPCQDLSYFDYLNGIRIFDKISVS